MNSEENKFPFKEQKDGKFVIRTFSKELKNEELVWHRDAEDRIIIPLHESDWKIQLDDELPKNLNINEPILIESEQFHRLIKGDGNLEIKIYKLNLNEVDNLKEIISDSLQISLEERGKDSRTKKGIKVPGKYLTSKSSKKRAQMKKEIDKFAKKHHSNPKAYTKQWEADKGEKTKTS